MPLISADNARVSVPDSDDDDLLKGPSLNADGRLERRFGEDNPINELPPPPDAPLELQKVERRAPEARVEVFRQAAPPPSRSRALLFTGVALSVAIAVLVAALVLQPKVISESPLGVSEPTLGDRLNVGEREPLIISSTPTGARITIGGKYIGDTPWAGDNVWSGDVPIAIEARGYQAFQGTITGGAPKQLDVRLKKER